MAKAEKARLDADKKAKPKTRLIRQANPAHAIDPSQGASAIEHEDGSRTALRVPRNDRPEKQYGEQIEALKAELALEAKLKKEACYQAELEASRAERAEQRDADGRKREFELRKALRAAEAHIDRAPWDPRDDETKKIIADALAFGLDE